MKTNLKSTVATFAAALLSIILQDHGQTASAEALLDRTAKRQDHISPVSAQRLIANPKGFIPNVGQLPNDSVKFVLRDSGVSAYFTEQGFVLCNGQTTTELFDGREVKVPVAPRWGLVGAKPVAPIGGDVLKHTVSYFRGNDPAQWRANVPAYHDLRYPEILTGVEMRVESRERGFEYSFHIQPNAKPDLRFRYDGITALEKSLLGDLIVRTTKGHFTESRPVSYQMIEGTRREVESWFEMVSANEYRIAVGPYDEAYELIIDPVLDWSTFWGASQPDNSKTLKVDSAGNIIVAGNSFSADLPESSSGFGTGPGVNSSGGAWYRDAYVAKFSPDGTQLIWAGYLGGNGATDDEMGWKGLAVDSAGDVYVSGFTMSPDFPVTTATPYAGALDVFVTKIKSDGSQILWSRLLGGAAADWSSGVALDPSGHLFVAGYTRSADLPVTPLAAFDQNLGGTQDAFVAKLATASGAVQWCSYLGGSADERVVSVVATAEGGAVVFGDTASSDFPTVAAFQSVFGGVNDAFVTKVAGDGASLVWSTFLGGSDKEHDLLISTSDPFPVSWAKGDVALDSLGNVLVVGQTYSANFPTTPGALQPTRRGNNDGYVTKLASDGSLLWSSYLGGTGPADPDGREEIAWGVTVNPWDEILVAGWTQSTNFPTTPGAFKPSQPNSVRSDGFLAKLNAAGSQLLYSTYIGGYENNDVALGVTYDHGNVFMTGWASAASFPTTAGAYQTGCVSCETPNLWASDGFVLKFLDAFIAHDGFESGNYSGGTGWTNAWTATGDNSLLTSSGPHSGTRHVRLRRGTGLLQRTVSIPAGSTSLKLGFWSKVHSFEGGEHANVRVSANGGSLATVRTLTSAQSDNIYHFYEIDLTSFLPATQIQITFDANMGDVNDNWYLDDIRLTGTSAPVPPVANAGADQTVTDSDNSGAETVTLNGSASFDPDGGGIVAYEWKEGMNVLGTAAILNTNLSVGVHTITLTVTDDEVATDSDTIQVTVNAPPPQPTQSHVGDLDGSASNQGSTKWKATVVVTIHNNASPPHQVVSGATVTGTWSGDYTGTFNATTGSNGQCSFSTSTMPRSGTSNVTFTITSVQHTSLNYIAAANHNSDGDGNNGTTITVNKPL